MLDVMREHMAAFNCSIEVVIEIMNVHISVAETPPWRNVEVSNDLIDTNSSLYAASFLALGIQSLAVVFALALLYIFSSSKGPRLAGICLSNFVTGVTTAGFLCSRGSGCAITCTAVLRIQMRRLIFSVPVKY